MSVDRSACTAPRHGTESAYARAGCRCPDAREDTRIKQKRRREGRHQAAFVPQIGTMRRLQALSAIGWPNEIIAARMGVNATFVSDLRVVARPKGVHRVTALKVRRVYEALSGSVGPSVRTRRWAERRGWVPPLGWDNIDDPNARPVYVPQERTDRPAEVLWLIRGGVPLDEAVARAGTTLKGWDRSRYRRTA